MSRHTLLFVISILVFLICALGIYLYNYANSNLAEIQEDMAVATDQISNDKEQSVSWLNKLANTTKKEYVLPVNQIYIEYARPLNSNSKTAYQLLVDKNDNYSFFCVTQTLRNTKVDFTIVKDGVKSQIFLNTTNSELLQSVITQLRAYDIQTSVIEVKI